MKISFCKSVIHLPQVNLLVLIIAHSMPTCLGQIPGNPPWFTPSYQGPSMEANRQIPQQQPWQLHAFQNPQMGAPQLTPGQPPWTAGNYPSPQLEASRQIPPKQPWQFPPYQSPQMGAQRQVQEKQPWNVPPYLGPKMEATPMATPQQAPEKQPWGVPPHLGPQMETNSQVPEKFPPTLPAQLHHQGQETIDFRKIPEDMIRDFTGKARHYYIAAVDVQWNYDPGLHSNSSANSGSPGPPKPKEPEEGSRSSIFRTYLNHMLENFGYFFDFGPKHSDWFFKKLVHEIKEAEENAGNQEEQFKDRYFGDSYDPIRLGRVYKKAIFREFTDETYTVLKRRESWQGILGPTIRAEVGDMAIVHFLNNASMPLSMHPHGTRYVKVHEGALYEDNTGPDDKVDDRVPPGGRHTYNWFFIPKDGPTKNDPDCLTWMYHSHRNADTDIHAGLLGPIIICRRGTLDRYDRPRNVDRSFVLVFLIFDENDSFYIDDNIERHAPGITPEQRERLKRDPAFRRSNLMFSINGLGWNNLPGLDMCLGDKVGWHIVGMGNEVDVHTISFAGQVLTINGRTSDTIPLFPAKFTTSLMIASRPGSFPVLCEVGIHSNAGMEATFSISSCPESRRITPKLNGKVREIFLAAEEVAWNYAPSGINRFNGRELTRDKNARDFFIRNATRIGGEYRKVVYREYTDETFRKRAPRTYEEAHLALLGPTIRAEVGDVVKVTFMNKASRPYNVQTRGAYYEPETDPVQPGASRTYSWVIAEQYGPTASDPQCITYRYYSNVDFLRDTWSGLIGSFLVCKPGSLDAEGKQKNIDREFTIFFTVMDEMQSHYIEENIMEYTKRPRQVNVSDPAFIQSNQMHGLNGRAFGNLEGLSMCLGEKISWHILAFGKQIDIHTAYFHGQTFQIGGRFKDTLSVTPSTHYTVIMHADNPGDWALDCRTNAHFNNGMRAVFRVEDCHQSFGFPNSMFFHEPRNVREYYIGAVEEDWNFAPTDVHIIDGAPLLSHPEGRFYLQSGPDRIGRIYKKAMYREFTDSSFSQMKPRSPEEEHLAVMGPYIRAEVGEMIRVVFKNMASRPYNIHPHGVILERTHDFAFQDHVDEDEGPVQPGEMTIYEWLVPERAGPGRTGFNCTSWAYYSTVDVVQDTNSGLMGPLVTCREGILSPSGQRTDVDIEFTTLFTIFDENRSWYIRENIQRFTSRPQSVNTGDPQFQMSNRMHSVNGRLFGSLEGLVAPRNAHAAWYLITMGTQIDMHTAHFHGQTFIKRNDSPRRGDVVYLFPGVFETIEMFMDNPGTWFLHCHVDDHMRAGMSAVYTVQR